MDADRRRQLQDFVAYAKTLRGDEKGEAQVFLDRLFRAFSQGGYKEAGATLEERVKNAEGGTGFADLVWKPKVLIEMKKRGEDLSRHLLQAFRYWEELVPGRPRYVVLCNFDEFRIYDFDQDIHQPQDVLTLDELPGRYGPLNFLWPTNEPAHFRVDREKVTREAADILAGVYKSLKSKPGVTPETAQRFVLQALICFFSEDIGLLPKHFFTELLNECTDPPRAFDLFDSLFHAMNSRERARGGRFAKVDYFNGGIFAQSAAVELDPQHEVALLKRAATYNWADVSPDIFGTIFQHSMDEDERHAMGAHYTSQVDIMRIVGPTIVQPFSTAIERASTLKELTALRDRLSTLRVLDPACGSGNFLYIAYREMRRLEAQIILKQSEMSKRDMTGQGAFGAVSPRQFFGMDILPFAVELAKVTLAIAPKLAKDELHTAEAALPLDNLDANIVVKDALLAPDLSRAEWPAADVIIGNPPFLGSRYFAKERGYDYVRAVHAAYPEVPKMADLCVYWFRRAHDHLPAATSDDPFAGRAGLVGTQNVRNNESRIGGLDHIAKSAVIHEAVSSEPWSGEANVHVSIANWQKHMNTTTVDESALLIPEKRRLWVKVERETKPVEGRVRSRTTTPGRRISARKDKSFELELRLVDHINSSLSYGVDVAGARQLACNTEPQMVFQGQNPANDQFMLAPSAAKAMITADRNNRQVLFPYMIGRDMLGECRPSRWIIDFAKRDMLQASAFAEPFNHVKTNIMPAVLARADEERKATGKATTRWTRMAERWWQFRDYQPGMMKAIARLPRYIVCSRTTKRPVFAFVSKTVHPDSKLMVFAFSDDFSFGIMQASAHLAWFVTKSSKLTERFNYTPSSVWDTFPWPQSPAKKQVRAVAKAARDVRAVRAKALPTIKGGLRALYRTLELPGANPLKDAHAALDAAVLEAYGFSGRKDILKQLLDLNLSVAAAIDRGERVTGPGVPPEYGDAADLITDDCIQA